MNVPPAKNEKFGFHATVEMSRFRHVRPSFDEKPWNVSISRFPESFRLSYQIACRFPASSTASQGKNWSFGAAAPLAVIAIGRASDQVAPESRDCWSEMSAPDFARLMLFWYAKLSDRVCGLNASDGEIGARNCFPGRMSFALGLSANCPGLSICTGIDHVAPPVVERVKKKP